MCECVCYICVYVSLSRSLLRRWFLDAANLIIIIFFSRRLFSLAIFVYMYSYFRSAHSPLIRLYVRFRFFVFGLLLFLVVFTLYAILRSCTFAYFALIVSPFGIFLVAVSSYVVYFLLFASSLRWFVSFGYNCRLSFSASVRGVLCAHVFILYFPSFACLLVSHMCM